MRVFQQIMALLAGLGGLWLYLKGRGDVRDKNLRNYSEIRERMDDAQRLDSVDAARGWLRERPKGRR